MAYIAAQRQGPPDEFFVPYGPHAHRTARDMSRLEELCLQKGLKMTGQRRVIARVLSDSTDHPDVEQVYRRASAIDPKISIATV